MRKNFHNITKNFSFLLTAQIVYKVFAFFTYILIARYLGVMNFGQFSFVLSLVGLFTVAADFGLNELLIRDIAGRPKDLKQEYINNVLSLKLTLSVLTYLIVCVISLIISGGTNIKIAVLVFGLCLVVDSFTIFFRSIFRLFERMEFEALSLVVEAVLKFVFVLVVLKFFKAGILNIAGAFLITSLTVAVATLIPVNLKFTGLRVRIGRMFVTDLLKKALPFAFLAFFGVINFKIAVIIISLFKGNTPAGLFSAANKLIEPILVVPVVASVSLFPVVSRLYKESQHVKLALLFKRSLKILFLTGISIVIMVNIFAEKIILIVFGSEYLDSVIALRLLSLSLVPFFLKFFLERFILVLNRPKIIISGYLISVFIIIFMSFLLINIMGYAGVIMALILSESFIIAYNLIAIKDMKYA
jgi:O-antigen/teichoic acid export membrane protein